MAKLDFPTDRANLNPPKAAGALQDGDTTLMANSQLYVWKKAAGQEGYWISETATGQTMDDRYLNKAGDTATGTVNFPNINVDSVNTTAPGQPTNLFDNGDFWVNQRNPSLNVFDRLAGVASYYFSDRWLMIVRGSGECSFSYPSVDGRIGSAYALSWTSKSAGHTGIGMYQGIELNGPYGGNVYRPNQLYCYSVWSKNPIPNFNMMTRDATTGTTYDTWTKVGGVVSGETVADYTRYHQVFRCPGNRPNIAARCISCFHEDSSPDIGGSITAPQVEFGDRPTPFVADHKALSWQKCTRMFYRTDHNYSSSWPTNGGTGYLYIDYPTQMRVSPTVQLTAGSVGTSYGNDQRHYGIYAANTYAIVMGGSTFTADI